MRRLGLRARLTILVTAVFAIAVSVTSVLVLGAVEDRLVADTRASAESLLGTYLESIYGGVATVGVVGPDAGSRFFYLDDSGGEISEQQYFEAMTASFDREFVEILSNLPVLASPVTSSPAPVIGGTVAGRAVPIDGFAVDSASGVLSVAELGEITLIAGPIPTGEPRPVDRGADLVAVAQTLTFADGATLAVGVSSPLRPVTDSLDTITEVLWVTVPVLVAMIGLATWQAAGRALRPVAAIADQAGSITAANIDQRVPVHDARDEIRHLAVTVNDMLDRLERGQERQRQLVSDAAHELRSPVAASRAQLEVAAADPGGADWASTADVVLAEQAHLAELIDDLLALSRLDENGPGPSVDVDLDDLVAAEADRLPSPVTVTVGTPVRIVGNVALLTRAVRNLLDNAARHADAAVTVIVERTGGAAVVHVDDDGPGVPVGERERIFERFARIDDARDRRRGGAGLGLALARQVARVHGGDLTCADSPDGGARFTLTVPLGGV